MSKTSDSRIIRIVTSVVLGVITMVALFEHFPMLSNNLKVFIFLAVGITVNCVIDIILEDRAVGCIITWMVAVTTLAILLFVVFPFFSI